MPWPGVHLITMSDQSSMRVPRIKVCCISSEREVDVALTHGADALGFVSSMPSGPGVIPEDRIRRLSAQAPPGIGTFLLTSLTDVHGIIDQQRRCGTNTIQLCDRLTSGTHSELRAALPGISIVQVVHVTDASSVDEAQQICPFVNGILLDSGNTALSVKQPTS